MGRADLPSARAAREQAETEFAADDRLAEHLTKHFTRVLVHNPAIAWLSVYCPLGSERAEYGDASVVIYEERGPMYLTARIPLEVLHSSLFPLAYWVTTTFDEAYEAALSGDPEDNEETT